jgi:cholesterol oxidase
MYDFLIIGSGFGGAIPAYELSRAGHKVCVLERGPWREPSGVSNTEATPVAPLPEGFTFLRDAVLRIHHRLLGRHSLCLNRKGLFEIFLHRDMNVICSSSVGGGSHVYSGLHGMPLQNDYWDNITPGLSASTMLPHYEKMIALLGAHRAPFNKAGKSYNTEAEFHDLPCEQQPLWAYGRNDGEQWYRKVDFSKEGMFGSPQGQKTTLDRLLLLPAVKEHRLEIRACHEALSIHQQEQMFVVNVFDHNRKTSDLIFARKVIVAAGCINTVKLLHNSIARQGLPAMPALGKGFSGNADMFALWKVSDDSVYHPAYGPYQRIFAPGKNREAVQILQAGITGLPLMPLPAFVKKWLQKQLFVVAMGIDNANGEIRFSRGKLTIHYDESANPLIGAIRDHFKSITRLSKKQVLLSKKLSTVHPLGGAVISADIKDGVVNARGEVHNVCGLYITDAAALPKALGAPPSLNIAAWASQVADGIMRGFKATSR